MEFVSRGTPEQRHRLVILTDMENEPDDSQTMVKLLMYANEIDIEGLIAVTSKHLRHDNFPESIADRVKAYGVVRPNLMKHAPGWPTEDYLLSKTAGGQLGYGMAAVGDGRTTRGSELIVEALLRDDPRPVWFAINAGANTLAQALWDMRRDLGGDAFRSARAKVRVYDDSGQDDAGAWMCHEFPDLFYIRSRAQVFGLFGPGFGTGPQPWEPLDQYAWAEVNVRVRHGVLGALFPQRLWKSVPWKPVYEPEKEPAYHFLDGGGTTTWLGLVNKGLFEPEEISWGGWGGRFSWEAEEVPAGQHQVDQDEEPYRPFRMYPQAPDDSFPVDDPDTPFFAFSGVKGETAYYARDFAPLWRWRDAYTRDFAGRMDWCVAERGGANHHPVAVFAGDGHRTVCRLRAKAGEAVPLDASASYDPDEDPIRISWSTYPEAGTYEGEVALDSPAESVARMTVPPDAAGKQIHVILEVTDESAIVPLTSYRRIVVDVE